MIKITIELLCTRGRHCDKLLGIGTIANVGGTADGRIGHYDVHLSKMAPRERQDWKTGVLTLPVEGEAALMDLFSTGVVGFDRETRGSWDLLYIALRQLVGDRNPVQTPVASGATTRLRQVRKR